MQAKAKLQVLDEPVQPVDATGQTGHETGLTAQIIGNTNSAMKGDSSLKPKIRTGGSCSLLSKDPGRGATKGYSADNTQNHFSR